MKPGSDEYKKDCNLRHRYGITLVDFKRMFSEQKGRCALCKRLKSEDRLHVDHDHLTKRIRGLLCQTCNSRLSAVERLLDLEVSFENLKNYLTQP